MPTFVPTTAEEVTMVLYLRTNPSISAQISYIANQCIRIVDIPDRRIYVNNSDGNGHNPEYIAINTTHPGSIPNTAAVGSSAVEEEKQEGKDSGDSHMNDE